MVCQAINKTFVSHVHYSVEQAGWVERVPLGLKEFFNLPFLLLKARHSAPQHTVLG